MKQFHTKNTATLSTRGFYTILALCGLIIAASVWVLWSSSHRTANPIQDTPSVITPMDPDSYTTDTPVSVQVPDENAPSAQTGSGSGSTNRPVSAMQTDPKTEVGLSTGSATGSASNASGSSSSGTSSVVRVAAEPGITTGAGDPPASAAAASDSATPPDATESPTVSAPVYVRPVSGAVVTPFSGDELLFQPTLGDWRVHTGTDFLAEPNETVLALTDGTVSDVFDDGLYGTCVSLVHTADLTTTYRGLTDVRVVAGQAVAAGEALGGCAEQMDAEAALGTHIHVEAARAGTPVDVLELLSEDEPE